MEQGYIKIFRAMLDWEWYSDLNVRVLFIHCLLKANHKTQKWQGLVIEQGQFVTSLAHLAKETSLSVQQVRTSLNKLKSTQEITYSTNSRNTVITIKNWDKFQASNTNSNKQITSEQQTSNKQITTNKNEKNERNNNNTILESEQNLKIFGEYQNVCLSEEQHEQLLAMCMSNELLNELLNSLSRNIEVGKERPYIADLPNAHYERIKSYYNFRRRNPQRFVERGSEAKTITHSNQDALRRAMEKWVNKQEEAL